jgi:hypothetical protein
MGSALAFVLVVHAPIHLMGFAKASGYAQLPQLAIPIWRRYSATCDLPALWANPGCSPFGCA